MRIRDICKNITKAFTKVKPESKWLYLIDPGHGGINPTTQEYVTSGKRSPRFDDMSILYEGVNNRDNASRIIKALRKNGMEAIDIVDDWRDISLSARVRDANALAKTRKCVYISIHSDAQGMGKEWMPASGISVYTSPGKTKSDIFADYMIQALENNFNESVKWRFDSSDGDKDKEAHFAVLTGTNCPAILMELGFHTNKVEATRMLTDEWKDKMVLAVVEACKKWEDE